MFFLVEFSFLIGDSSLLATLPLYFVSFSMCLLLFSSCLLQSMLNTSSLFLTLVLLLVDLSLGIHETRKAMNFE